MADKEKEMTSLVMIGPIRRRRTENINFKAHVEYIYHVTCANCNNWFTYATMEKNQLMQGTWYCPKCGTKGTVELENV